MKARITFVAVFFLSTFLSSSAFSQDIDFEGYGEVGFRAVDRVRIIEYNQKTYFNGKFQVEFEVTDEIEGQLDFRGESEDELVELREFSAKFKYIDKLDIEVGNLKKPFGGERIVSSDDLISTERSFMSERISEIGYGGRSIGIMGAYEFDDDEPDFPHSYYFFIYKNNNLQTGAAARYTYHFGSFGASANIAYLNIGGEFPITSMGYGTELDYITKDFEMKLEALLVEDPVEAVRRRINEMDEQVYSLGGRFQTSYEWDIDGKVIEEIEPFVLLSYYQPDLDVTDRHTLQMLLGLNLYFDNDVRLRFNGDALFTKNEFSDDYSTRGSQFIVELQIRY